MAIVRLTGFDAEAEVMGLLRKVSWHEDEGLTIYGLKSDDAHAALNMLALHTLTGIEKRVESMVGVAPKQAAQELAEITKPATVPASPPPFVPAEAPKPQTLAQNVVQVEEKHAVNGSLRPSQQPLLPGTHLVPPPARPEGTKQDTWGLTPAAQREARAADDGVQAVAPEEPNPIVNGQKPHGRAYDLDKLRKLDTLRKVLEHLMHCGYTKREQLLPVLLELRAEVPVLQRVGDIADRLTRALEVMDSPERGT